MKIKILLFAIVISSPVGALFAMEKKPECVINEKTIHDDVKVFIHKKQVEEASEYLLSQQTCAKTDYEKAFLLDYQGEVIRAAYSFSGGVESVSKSAEEFYKKALSLQTIHDVVVYHHLALLMRDKKDYPSAAEYISKALNIEPAPEDPLPYLATALKISAESGNWQQARDIAGIIYNKKNSYFFDTRLLLPSVQTFCVTGELDLAAQFISLIKKHNVPLDSVETKYYEKSIEVFNECKDRVI